MRAIHRLFGRLKGVLFDLDGTLVHTDHLHFLAWEQIAQKLGIVMTTDLYEENISGRQNPPVIRELRPDLLEKDVQDLSLEKEALFREMARESTEPVEGIVDFLQILEDMKIPKCIVTNAPRINVDMMLEGSGLQKYFSCHRQILGDECAHAKPHPEPYLVGLQRLEIQSFTAVAFEDSIAGASAALAAGIPTIGVLTTLNPDAMQRAGVFCTIPNYTES
eukprot:gene5497-7189_t